MSWWAWAVAALILLAAELAFGSKLLVGFVIGAGLMTGLAWLGWPASTPVALAVFGGLSLVAWVVLRLALGVRAGQVKRFDHDINE